MHASNPDRSRSQNLSYSGDNSSVCHKMCFVLVIILHSSRVSRWIERLLLFQESDRFFLKVEGTFEVQLALLFAETEGGACPPLDPAQSGGNLR
jgi:hypothetical protein